MGTANIAALHVPTINQDLNMDCNEALQRLKAGNQRFVDGKAIHPHSAPHLGGGIVNNLPLATILGCSDALTPPELIFDQGAGDLFVIRVAGNVAAPDVIGSVQYAGAHLGTRLFIVLGHEDCGTVRAALLEKLGRARQPAQIEALVRLIRPALAGLDIVDEGPESMEAAVEANVRWSLQQLLGLPGARKALKEGQINMLGAICEPDTGWVRFLENAPGLSSNGS
jgi:carbonic anhydrase